MTAYHITVPVSIDGVKFLKELRVEANSVMEAHLKAVAVLNQVIEEVEDLCEEES